MGDFYFFSSRFATKLLGRESACVWTGKKERKRERRGRRVFNQGCAKAAPMVDMINAVGRLFVVLNLKKREMCRISIPEKGER